MRNLALILAVTTAVPAFAQNEFPTESEAVAAYEHAYATRPMRVRDDEEMPVAELGECGDNPYSVGIACQMFVSFSGTAPQTYLVGFARQSDGWVATIYGRV